MFKRPVFRLFRLPSKFRQPPPRSNEVTLPADNTLDLGEFGWRQERVHVALKPTSQLPIEVDATGVMEDENGEDDGEVEFDGGDEELEGGDEKGEGGDEERDGVETEEGVDLWEKDGPMDTPQTFPFDLAHKTRLEMIVYRLYIALSDDDHEIAALRTRQCDKFTHVIRITFDPPSDKVLPSNWSAALSFLDGERLEMRVTCPSFVRRLGDYNRALTKQQLFFASRFIAYSLPYRHDKWLQQGFRFPFSDEECRDSRVLIVAPTDRSVDVLAIIVSYLSSLMGARGQDLLNSMRKFNLVDPHWKECLYGNMAAAILNQK